MISLSASANCPTRATNRARPWRHFFASAYTRAGPTLLSIKPWRITFVQYFFDVFEFASFPRQLSNLSWLGASWPFLRRIPRITFLWRHIFHRIRGWQNLPGLGLVPFWKGCGIFKTGEASWKFLNKWWERKICYSLNRSRLIDAQLQYGQLVERLLQNRYVQCSFIKFVSIPSV